MKTILRKKYLKRLANLNDQLCYFQFTRNELNKRLDDFGDNAKKLYLPDIFAQNDMAPRIHITLDELPKFQSENQTVTFGAYISTSYEVVSYYIEDSLDFLQQINPSTYQSNSNNQLEERYLTILTNSSCTTIDREIIDTLKYIRLRRNYFIHLHDSLSNVLEDLIKNQGLALNTYWANTIKDLDFTSTSISIFREEETIDIINLLQIMVKRMDENLASNLSEEGIITHLAEIEFAPKPQNINTDVIKQRVKKIISLGKKEFGITLLESDIEPIVREIGKK